MLVLSIVNNNRMKKTLTNLSFNQSKQANHS